MSATMARQGGRVQLEQSDMRLGLSMAKMAKGGYLLAATKETQQPFKNPRANVREEKTRGVEFPGHEKVKAAIQRHPAAPPPHSPSPPGTPPVPPCDTDGNESYEIECMPSKCVYLHCPLPKTQFLNQNAYAKDSKHDKDCIPDLLRTLSAAWKYH